MKTVIFIHQHFRTPEEGGGVRSFFLAEELVKAGINVIVLRGGKKQTLNPSKSFTVHGLGNEYDQKFSFRNRIRSFAGFSWSCIRFVRKLSPKPNLAYVISTPLSVGLVGIYAKRLLGIPFVFEVGDLWPDVPIQMGILRNPFLKLISAKLERTSYNNAVMISSLSVDISESIRKKNKGSKLLTIPNFSDNGFFGFQEAGTTIENGKLHLGYFGAAGKANGLDFIARLVEISSQKKYPVQFHFMMEGSELGIFQEKVRSFENVIFYPYGNREKVKEKLDKIDVGLVSFSNYSLLGTGSPNKLFDYLAAGKVVICNSEGWFQSKIEKSECGFYIPYNSPELLFEKLDQIQDPKNYQRLSANARGLAKREFDTKGLLEIWRKEMLNLEALTD